MIRGFFLDDRHLGFQFEYMTDTAPLNQNIADNLKTQIGNYFDLGRVRKW